MKGRGPKMLIRPTVTMGEVPMKFAQRPAILFTASLLLLCFGPGSILLRAQITGGMLDPSIDPPDEPFSYFWHPTDVIGALYAPVATEVTPEGYLSTGFGELMFFVGNPLEPVNERIKTLYKGYLPIVQYRAQSNDVNYTFTLFSADLGGGLKGLPVNFVKVELRNEIHEQRTAFLSSAYRFSPPTNALSGLPDYRFSQKIESIPKQYIEGQKAFSSDWKYSLAADALVRDGRVLYFFPVDPEPWQVSQAFGDNGMRVYRYFTGEVEGEPKPKYVLDPHTPMGVVSYQVTLSPGQSQELIFKMPIVPLPHDSAEAEQVRRANYGKNFELTVSIWDKLVAKSPTLRFPETKVQNDFLANNIFNLLGIDKEGDDYVPNINKFQYHNTAGGANTADMIMGWEYLGLEEISRNTILYLYKMQTPEGGFKIPSLPTVSPYWEIFGYVLWLGGRHYQLTHDLNFLQQIYPSVVRAMDWEEKITRTDPLGLMPKGAIADDAYLKDSHQTGQNMWVLIGLRNAITMATGMGNSEDVQRFKAEYQRYWSAFEKQLTKQTAQSGGYIPPSLDRTLKGNNWDNLLTLYPEPLFDPFDPRVTATLRESRGTYSEGILGYVYPGSVAKNGEEYTFNTERQLHYWQTPDNAENELVRDSPEDQELAVKDLYALLLHTSSTHAPQEFGTFPWSTRDFEMFTGDILPDGASSGKTIQLMRNMLVREYKNDLYLFSAVSPEWLKEGKKIEVVEEPTTFGPVSAVLTTQVGGFEVRLSNRFRQAPEHVVIPVPWFYEATSAEADGRPVEIKEGRILLSTSTKEVKVKGRKKAGAEELSYERAVENYKREYTQRYQEFLRTGSVQPKD